MGPNARGMARGDESIVAVPGGRVQMVAKLIF